MKRCHLLTLCLSPVLSAALPTALGADSRDNGAALLPEPAQQSAEAQSAGSAEVNAARQTAGAEQTPRSLEENRRLISRWEGDIDRLRERLAEFRAEALLTPAEGDTPMPEPVPGEAIIDCDGGLLFDVNAAQLIYVNNVRLSEQRLRLRADLQLLVQLERGQLDEQLNHESLARQGEKKPERGADAAASAPGGASGAEHSSVREEQPVDAPAGASANGEGSGDDSSADSAEARKRESICTVSTTSALADTEKNRLLLSTRGGQQPIIITGENQQLTLRSNGKRHASLLADEHGDVLAVCGSLHLQGLDRDDQPYTLEAEQGEAWYNAAERSLTVAGPCRLLHARGELSCRDGLTLYFDSEGKAEPEARRGYMSQFADMQLSGIRRAEAHGSVRLVTKATEDQPACAAAGEHLDYDATNGDCRLSGPDSSLEYGGYALSKAETLHLAPNGDITLTGPELHGRYERKGSGNKPMAGRFTASRELRFTAADGRIRTEHGLELRDSDIDFKCSGPVTLTLAKSTREAAAPDRAKTGMLNLAIADYSDIAHIDANGDVVGHFADNSEAPAPEACSSAGPVEEAGEADRSRSGSSLKGDHLVADLVKGSATIEAPVSREASLSYCGNSVTALSTEAGEDAPRLTIAENGDLLAVGGRIRAHLLTDEGPADATCRGKMELIRAEGLIATGSDAAVNAPAGLFTANGPLVLTLAPDESSNETSDHQSDEGKGLKDGASSGARADSGTDSDTRRNESRRSSFAARYPHLNYAYSGLKRLRTEQGGTARTAQASMECGGLIDISLLPESRREKNAVMGPIEKALLCDRVSILAKDSSGRLLRASGDRMEADAATGEKVITGRRVTLSDENNTHIASGAGAAVRIDRNNNARITGQHQSTTATNIRRQTEQTKTGAAKPAKQGS